MSRTTFITDIEQQIACPTDSIIRVNDIKASSNTPNCDNRALQQQVTNLCEGRNSCSVENSVSGCPKYLYSFTYTCEPLGTQIRASPTNAVRTTGTGEGAVGTGITGTSSSVGVGISATNEVQTGTSIAGGGSFISSRPRTNAGGTTPNNLLTSINTSQANRISNIVSPDNTYANDILDEERNIYTDSAVEVPIQQPIQQSLDVTVPVQTDPQVPNPDDNYVLYAEEPSIGTVVSSLLLTIIAVIFITIGIYLFLKRKAG